MISYKQCPVCKSADIVDLFLAKDHSVSGEFFPVMECHACTALFTQHVPDKNDIGRYYQSENYISHSDTQEGVVNKLYHLARKLTLKAKRALVEKETGLARGRILDIGCGTGAFLNTMYGAGWECIGLEPDEAARKKANELYGIQPEPSAALFGLDAQSFDAITMWHVLEHVHDLHSYITQIKDLLSEDGKAIIGVPNYTSYDAEKYGKDWAGYDFPRHLYHFSPRSMRHLMHQHGLKVMDVHPLPLDSYYVSMLSEKYRNGNILRAFFTGWLSNVKANRKNERSSSLIYVVGKVTHR